MKWRIENSFLFIWIRAKTQGAQKWPLPCTNKNWLHICKTHKSGLAYTTDRLGKQGWQNSDCSIGEQTLDFLIVCTGSRIEIHVLRSLQKGGHQWCLKWAKPSGFCRCELCKAIFCAPSVQMNSRNVTLFCYIREVISMCNQFYHSQLLYFQSFPITVYNGESQASHMSNEWIFWKWWRIGAKSLERRPRTHAHISPFMATYGHIRWQDGDDNLQTTAA